MSFCVDFVILSLDTTEMFSVECELINSSERDTVIKAIIEILADENSHLFVCLSVLAGDRRLIRAQIGFTVADFGSASNLFFVPGFL
jgi:hypothetical protein